MCFAPICEEMFMSSNRNETKMNSFVLHWQVWLCKLSEHMENSIHWWKMNVTMSNTTICWKCWTRVFLNVPQTSPEHMACHRKIWLMQMMWSNCHWMQQILCMMELMAKDQDKKIRSGAGWKTMLPPSLFLWLFRSNFHPLQFHQSWMKLPIWLSQFSKEFFVLAF